MRWIRIESDELHDLMEHAQKAKQSIGIERIPATWASHNHYIYSHLKKLMVDLEPAGIVTLVAHDNGLEAWRKLTQKYVPKTLGSKSLRLRRITTFGIQNQARNLSGVSVLIDHYESNISKDVEDYEQTPVSDDVKKDVLLQILPKSLESAIKDAMMHYEKDETGMDYEFVKSLVLQRVDREAAPEDDDPNGCRQRER